MGQVTTCPYVTKSPFNDTVGTGRDLSCCPDPFESYIFMNIPESEVKVLFSRAGGHGGQNVNKTSTRVQLSWNVGQSSSFSAEEKAHIRNRLKNRLTRSDEIIVTATEERSQSANRARAMKRLLNLVAKALQKPKVRIPTKATYSSKLKRLNSKRALTLKKKARKIFED